MRYVHFFIVVIVAGLITGCSGNQFDRSLILENAAENLIMPAYQDFQGKTDSLNTAIKAFAENPNAEHLNRAQSAWEDASLSWKRAELYNFGPVEDQYLVTSINRWPTSEAGIETAIEEYDGSEDYLVRIGSNRKGLPALEYLLFHADNDEVLQEFQDENSRAYTLLLAQSLADISQQLIGEWESGYEDEFVASTGNRPNSGITLIANEMGFVLEMIRMDKIEIPFGKQTMGTPRLQMLESEYAHISKEQIRENLRSAQQTFNGGEGQGFDDYLDALNIKGEDGLLLSEAINQEYDKALEILASMEGSFESAIMNEKEKVEALIETVQQIYIYTEVDMISQLNLLDTFSDNDGD